MATKADYDTGAAAALALIRHEIEVLPIPGFARGMIPVDKEPAAAAAIAKVVIDAVDAGRAKLVPPGGVAPAQKG
jgi:hypothetical protein